MDKNEILAKLQEIIRKVCENNTVVLALDMERTDIEGWSSLRQIQLIMEIEEVFDINVNPREALSWTTIGAIVETISVKL